MYMLSNFLYHTFFFIENRLIYIYYLYISIGFPWLRLVISREKNLLISYDPDHILYDADNVQKKKNNFEVKGNYILYFS